MFTQLAQKLSGRCSLFDSAYRQLRPSGEQFAHLEALAGIDSGAFDPKVCARHLRLVETDPVLNSAPLMVARKCPVPKQS